MSVVTTAVTDAVVAGKKNSPLAQRIKRDPIAWIGKPLVWAVCLAPLAWLAWLAPTGGLGANPIEFINRHLGDWGLRILLVSLAVTPLRIVTGWKQAVRFRRLIGLFAFFYVVLHVTNYVVVDHFFNWREIFQDIIKRWYITVGMVGLLSLTSLAITSTKGWIKRIGGRNWNRLHKLVYVAGVAGCIHFIMMRKGFQIEPLVYAGIFALLMSARLIEFLRRRFFA
ncbi:MAG: sulfoxide reductase heme-binding subunit YedZ [Proteobacteria bacterium]|nr:sulfoxide reductase heme-binding subunit YedZ [Pseudomonadota bacterium]